MDTDYGGHTHNGRPETYLRSSDGHRHRKTDLVFIWRSSAKQVKQR